MTKKLFLNKLETKILLPFYFNNVNIAENKKSFNSLLKTNLNESIIQLSNRLGSKSIFEQANDSSSFVTDLSDQTNLNIDLNKKINSLNEFMIKFHQNSYFKNHFASLNFYGSYFAQKETVEGAVAINLEALNLDFFTASKKIYLTSLINFFVRNQLMPLSFDNILEIINSTPTNNFLSQIKKSYIDKFNLVSFHGLSFQSLQEVWINLLNDKLDLESDWEKDYLKNDFFHIFISCLLIIIYLLKRLDSQIKKTSLFTLNNKSSKLTNKTKTILPLECFEGLCQIYKEELKYEILKKSFNEKIYEHLGSKKGQYLKLVEKQYAQNHLFISDVFIIYNCEHAEWDNQIFKNALFNKDESFLDVKNNELILFNDILIYSEKYAIDMNTKNFAYYSDYQELLKKNLALVQSENTLSKHILENNVNYFILCRKNIFINNQNNHVLNNQAKMFYYGLLSSYYWGIIFVISRYNIKINIEQYANFVTNMQFGNKSIEYRVILKDLRKIEFDSLHFIYGIQAIKAVVEHVDKQLNFSNSLEKLILKVRTEDEIGKLISERNSIATGFIVALFVSLMWFVDTVFAVYQSTGSGNSPAPYIVPEAMFYGFVGFTTFILFCITCMLIFTMTKLYVKYRAEKHKGIKNFF